ncbi:hypothetical protein SH591_08765 [Sphingomonas sp. LY54]|uniref:hypothetical protein n=1 Tax=Sphingomonas sp. LY54 TaxID=3095343 RepID=UPI002D79ABB0|nr:hypothetical protein [Sphingomonas sp. LY54]WRP27215.1 hypothetical protein SH591_08765 [Sphingomonas sp. LY54]
MIAYRTNYVTPPRLRTGHEQHGPVARDLLREINLAIRARGISATELGQRALNDPMFVHDLRNGRRPRRGTREKVLAYLRQLGEGRA